MVIVHKGGCYSAYMGSGLTRSGRGDVGSKVARVIAATYDSCKAVHSQFDITGFGRCSDTNGHSQFLHHA
jgi:hypothetical protein